jgi:hypothetical protein
MKIKSIRPVGKKPVYDISVDEVEQYILANGVVTHNTGMYYSSNQIFMIGRSQEKDGTDLTGYNFTLNVDKSRFVREKSKLILSVSFDGGIDEFSGLLDLALESGHVEKPKNGWFTRPNIDQGKNYREKDTHTREFWSPIVTDESFKEFIRCKFQLSARRAIEEDLSDDSAVS